MALVVEEKPFVCLLSVYTLLEVVISFNDFYANEWQATVGSSLYCSLHGGMGFIQSWEQGARMVAH